MPNDSFESVLEKLSFTSVESKDFIDLLFQSDEKGIDYLSSLKKDFKEKYIFPFYNKAKGFYSKLNTQLDQTTPEKTQKALNDPLDIIKLNEEYKIKAKKIFEDKLKQLNGSVNLKNVVDSTADTSKKISISDQISNAITAALADILPKTSAPKTLAEQATFTEKPKVISLSEETLEKLKNILNIKVDAPKAQEQKQESGWLKMIGSLLAAGGIATILIGAFWDKIKPWLEEKFNFNLDFLDKFEGTLEGLSKFFTMGGLKMTGGWLFNLVGKAFTTLGDFLENALSGIFKFIFGGEVAEQGAKAAPNLFKSMFPKLVGGLFKGVGLVALKGIPVIGSLISFYFAYDRFNKGDYVGSIIDILGGISNLIPGVGLPLSIGLAALNAVLDYQAGGVPDDQKNAAKLNIIGSLAEKFYNAVKDIPFIGGLFKFGLGIYELVSGNFQKGLDLLVEQPYLGPLPAILKSLMGATVENEDGSKSFSFDKFKSEIKTNMFKWIISMVPNLFGMRERIAGIMGLSYNGTTGEVKEAELDVSSLNEAQTNLQKEAQSKFAGLDPKLAATNETERKKISLIYSQAKEDAKKAEEDYKKSWSSMNIPFLNMDIGSVFGTESRQNLDKKQQELVEIGKIKSETSKRQKENQMFETAPEDSSENYNSDWLEKNPEDRFIKFQNTEKVQDYMKPADGRPSLILSQNKTIETDPSDDIIALKTDGVLDKNFKNLSKIMESINHGIYKISNDFKNMPTQMPSPSMSIATTSGKKNLNDIVLSGGRDTIYELRTLWWRRSANFREEI